MAGSRVRVSLRWVAELLLGISLIASAAQAGSMSTEDAARHRRLLRQAEADFARGALQDGRAAAGEAVLLADRAGDPLGRAAARLVRANLLLSSGDPAGAVADLEAVLAAAELERVPSLALAARNNLAGAKLVLGDREAAEALYARVAEDATRAGDPSLAARARANRLRVRVDGGQSLEPAAVAAARAAVDALPDSADQALTRVHLGETLSRAAERGQGDRTALVGQANEILRSALVQADGLSGDGVASRIRAQALGHLGGLYVQEGRLEEALGLTRRALTQAGRSEVGAELFPWHLQSARLQARLGHRDAALDDYASALQVLEAHRGALNRLQRLAATASSDAADTSLLYREYVDLLLRRAREAPSPAARKADLLTAQSVLERLKSDELRDYFEDDCVIRYREKLASITEASFDAVIVYPFVLDDRLELLVSTGSELAQVVVDVPRDTLRAEVKRFRELLEKRTTRQYLRPARKLNDWLIAPIEEILADKNPRTLVFVPDGILRTIPMAPLHDGEHFLIERYALGLTPGLELTDPQPFGQQDRQALVAGISEGIDGFAPLPNVEREVETVHAMLGGDELLNERFSRRALTSRIREKPFGLIHIASHAQFDSTAEGGFVLAHDGRLSFDALADAVAASKFRDEALELVILSACETAQGDERAALGLSGVAVKAGARSALGTLWQVSDEATAEFMTRFYASLKEPGTSRAEAVRAGQLRLLRDAAYDHPFYWSPFLLINSWL